MPIDGMKEHKSMLANSKKASPFKKSKQGILKKQAGVKRKVSSLASKIFK